MTAAIQVDPAVSREPLPATTQNLPTICVLCSYNCGLLVDVEDGRITALRPDQSSLSAGYICSKASSIPWTINHSQRVEHPLAPPQETEALTALLGTKQSRRSPRS